MKKLFTLALIGVFSTILTSCSNTAGEQIQEPVNQTHQNEYQASNRGLSNDPISYVSDKEVYYYGERLEEIFGEEVDFVHENIKNSEFARGVKTQCRIECPDGMVVILSQAYGDGRPSNYYITMIYNGDMTTYTNPGLTCSDVKRLEGVK